MPSIIHHRYGDPTCVLEVVDGKSPVLMPDHVRVRVVLAPIHPGDLLGIQGSPV